MSLEPPAARPLPAGLADDAQGDRADPERGARRPGDGRDRGGGTDADRRHEVVGLGRPGPAPRPARGGGRSAPRGARRPAPTTPSSRPARAGLAARGAARPGRRPRRRPARFSTAAEDRVAPGGGPQLPGPGPAAHRAARARPRRRPAPAGRRRGRGACSTPARRRASPSFPTAAARAWSAASTPSRDGHAAVVSLDLARLRSVELDPRSLTARLGPGLSRARGRGGAGRPRSHARATSRSPSSRRRSAASPRPARPARPRAATGASTTLVTSIELTAPGRTAANPRRSRTPPPARRCASWSSARRGPSA